MPSICKYLACQLFFRFCCILLIYMEEEKIVEEGLGLAKAAGLTGAMPEYDFFAAFWHYFQNDLISSLPITLCSFLVVAVIIERTIFYNRNNRDISVFIHSLQVQLEKGNLEAAQMLATQLGSVIGEVAEEGIRLIVVQKEDFSRSYDITVNLVTRKLQKYLPILATIGAIAPFLGLFGTVSGVIKSLYHMSLGQEGASLTMIGEISNALIATGYGLAIAIISVVAYNLFGNVVKRYGDDFLLLKLLFMSFSNVDFGYVQQESPRSNQGADLGFGNDNNESNKPPYPDYLR